MDNEDDFAQLTTRLQRRIDKIFDKATEVPTQTNDTKAQPWEKRKRNDSRNTNDDTLGGGGFIVSEDEDVGKGLALVDDDVEMSTPSDSDEPRIPMSMVPFALQRLDLPPDDPDVLSVFANASSGWSGGKDEEGEQGVSRKDWRAVCAVLLSQRPGSDDDNSSAADLSEAIEPENPGGFLMDSEDEFVDEDGEDSDEYIESASSSDSGSNKARQDLDDDDYLPNTRSRATRRGKPPKRGKRARFATPPSVSSEEKGPVKLTQRQKRECRLAFALFFPEIDADDEALLGKRIMIKDISRAAQTLKEKITAEEIVEMLEAFSTSPDKSVGLPDFEKMMMAAHLA